MPIKLTQQTALVTGASRGIGRGIALKLAEQGVKRIAINYKENDAAAENAARLLKERGAAPLLIKADIGKVADIQRMFETIKSQFGGLDIFVSNARATLATGFYAEPMEIPLEAWQATFDTQATEFLVAVRAAVPMMGKNGRIIAITYAPGGQTGSWQPWVAMGSAKAAKEALARYFAVALAQKGITVKPSINCWLRCRGSGRPDPTPATQPIGEVSRPFLLQRSVRYNRCSCRRWEYRRAA